MGSENTASYAKIGIVVVAGVFAILGTLVYLGGLRGGNDLVFAETYYDKSVSGLSVGSVVNFRGVKIGEVKKIGFVGDEYHVTGDDNQRIYILMAFPRNRLVSYEDEGVPPDKLMDYLVDRLSLRATVTASGITGLSRVEIDITPGAAAPRKISWTPRNCYIPSTPSLLDNFSDSATKVMNQIDRMDIAAVWSNISSSVSSLAGITEGVQTLLNTRSADVEKLLGDLSETVSTVKDLAQELKENPSLFVRERIPHVLPETQK